MYKIKNMTRGKLFLFDIGVKLDRGETIDLDAKLPRDKIESSANLKVAEDNELIAILHKDVVTQTSTSLSFDPNVLAEMERRIREQIMENMKPKVASAPTQNNDVAHLTAKISELITKIDVQHTSEPIISDEITPDVDKLFEVHAKALKRMTQGSEGFVEAKEHTSQSDVGKRANELDEFLK